MAQNHVGIIEEPQKDEEKEAYTITSRVNTATGVRCRIVAKELPDYAMLAEPTLEDAYMYLITGEADME